MKLKTTLLLFGLMGLFSACRQEKLMFYPDKLPSDYTFHFPQPFEELWFKVDKKTKVNGLLFPADSAKGLVFYLHGNGGCIDSWGEIAELYLKNNYDFFILDYRGYGKSEGKISSEKQLMSDLQLVYDSLKNRYQENKIVIIGYSIGTGFAAYLASKNHPKQLILKAPYVNFTRLALQYASWVPSFMIRYKLTTDEYVKKTSCPIVIFHGDKDEVIDVNSSYTLKTYLKKQDSLFILKGQTHNGINDNAEYRQRLSQILQ